MTSLFVLGTGTSWSRDKTEAYVRIDCCKWMRSHGSTIENCIAVAVSITIDTSAASSSLTGEGSCCVEKC
jgi:hypothetical protein